MKREKKHYAMFGIALLLDKITECVTSGTCSADTLVDYNWSDLALFWAVVVLKNLLGEDIILFLRPLTHGVQFLVWEHQRPVGGEGVMVREAFRKYCKKSETIDRVKIYKCCRENYTQIPTQTQHQNALSCSHYEDWMSNWALQQTSFRLSRSNYQGLG